LQQQHHTTPGLQTTPCSDTTTGEGKDFPVTFKLPVTFNCQKGLLGYLHPVPLGYHYHPHSTPTQDGQALAQSKDYSNLPAPCSSLLPQTFEPCLTGKASKCLNPELRLPCFRYFFLNAGILVVGLIAYVIIARNYTEKPVVAKAAAAKAAQDNGMPAADEFKAA